MMSEFPPLRNDSFLRAARGESVEKIPVWIMRQAGRYLPEFREVRKHHDFFSLCQTPELACEVTLQPIRRFPLDASIIFSDILVIPRAMGMKVEMVAGVGPVLPEPLNSPSDLTRLTRPDVATALGYVGDAIERTRKALDGAVPLIGFSGAPWTLMGYMVQGGGSSTLARARSWLYAHREDSHVLLNTITDVVVEYLVMQAKHGAQALQIFESNADFLNDELFAEFSLRYLRRISKEVRSRMKEENLPEIPMIAFPKGATVKSLESLASEELYEVLGVDWKIDPAEARSRLGDRVTLQGNLDPCALFGTKDEIKERARSMAMSFGKDRYIANLGHGILPETPISSVEAFIEGIKSV